MVDGEMSRRFRFLMLLVAVVALGVVLYTMPRSKGDAFVNDLLKVDVAAMSAHLCPDTTLAQVIGVLAGSGGEIGNALALLTGAPIGIPGRETIARTLISEAAYYPFTGAYVFRLKIAQSIEIGGFRLEAGASSPEMTLFIGRLDLLRPCVRAG
jgi:hypothetical protein